MKVNSPVPRQQCLFTAEAMQPNRSRFISAYRLALVRDRQVSFDSSRISTSQEACPVIRKLIQTYGQSDREQFCELLLNSKNDLIGLNIVSTGTVTSAQVCPREALKPAILANASAVIFAHNHPSGHIEPSPEDIHLTENLVKAFQLVGITVHEHIIVSMFDERYYSFADQGIIRQISGRIG